MPGPVRQRRNTAGQITYRPTLRRWVAKGAQLADAGYEAYKYYKRARPTQEKRIVKRFKRVPPKKVNKYAQHIPMYSYKNFIGKMIKAEMKKTQKQMSPKPDYVASQYSLHLDCNANQCAYMPLSIGNMLWTKRAVIDTSVIEKTSNCQRVKIAGYTHNLELKNNNNSSLYLDILTYKIRIHTKIEDQGYEMDEFMTVFKNDYVAVGAGTLVADALVDPKFFPSAFKDVRKHYKLESHRTVFLQPGEKTVHNTQLKPWFYNYLQELESDKNSSQRVVILRIRGDVAHDTEDDSKVGFAPCSLDFVGTIKSRLYGIDSGPNLKIDVNNSTGIPAISTAETVNPQDPNVMEVVDITE
eukprot:GHVU01063883.1.p1 GENE.GHVU01063883.1~~GHVU01063883.1.p1  ORF type:complete len:355 (-),score=14.41 GHVU01063883.1:217-1281(-)